MYDHLYRRSDLFLWWLIVCYWLVFFFFFNGTATTKIYTLSLHDALPISAFLLNRHSFLLNRSSDLSGRVGKECRSEERFSRNAETDLVCRLLLEKKKTNKQKMHENEC